MIKYTEKFKTKVVKQYIGGKHGGFKLVAARHGIGAPTLRRWVAAYREHGANGLKRKFERYSPSFKLSVLQHMWENGLSQNQVAAIFNIRKPYSVGLWQRRYQEDGAEGLSRTPRTKPDSMKAPTRKPDDKRDEELSREDLLKRLDYLRMENEVLKKLQALTQARKATATPKRK